MWYETLISVVVGGLIVFISNFTLIYINENKLKENLRNAIKVDIESIENMITGFSNKYPNQKTIDYPIRIDQPFYGDYGIYYKIQGDILKLNERESKIAYEFYFNILIADSERKLILEHQKQNNDKDDYDGVASTKRMISAINKSASLIKDIKTFNE